MNVKYSYQTKLKFLNVVPTFFLKQYIQPFEKFLALAEMLGLLDKKDNNVFERPAESKFVLSISDPIDCLKERLAYWEKLDFNELIPTQQVILESERNADSLKNGKKFVYHQSRKLRYGPHGLHEYRGKFFPQLVKSIINFTGIKKGSTVIDPMCGSGTTNCEARSIGMKSIGADLNPLSIKIAKLKARIFEIDLNMLNKDIEKTIHNIQIYEEFQTKKPELWSLKDVQYLKKWFAPSALNEAGQILHSIRSISNLLSIEFMEVCFSDIIRKISWQKETDLRVRKELKEYKVGTAKNLFIEKVFKNFGAIESYLSHFVNKNEMSYVSICEGDARQINMVFPKWEGKCDLLITSPPYATALPYIDTDRLSLIILGILPKSEHNKTNFNMVGNREITEGQRKILWNKYLAKRKLLPTSVNKLVEELSEINHKEGVGFRKRNLPALLAKYYLDMTEAMRSALNMMKPGGFGVYIVGNNSTFANGQRFEIHTDKFLWEIGKKVGWKQQHFLNMDLLPSRDIFRNNRGSSESILYFQA